MRATIVYIATDGTQWSLPEDAERRDALDATVKAIEARCPVPPYDSGTRLRVTQEQMNGIRREVVLLCRELWPKEVIFQHDPDEIHPFSYAGRFLSEVGGPINRVWHRLCCWNGDWLYEQPFFALNPDKFKERVRTATA